MVVCCLKTDYRLNDEICLPLVPHNEHFPQRLDERIDHAADLHIPRTDPALYRSAKYSPTFVDVEPFRTDQRHRHADIPSLEKNQKEFKQIC